MKSRLEIIAQTLANQRLGRELNLFPTDLFMREVIDDAAEILKALIKIEEEVKNDKASLEQK